MTHVSPRMSPAYRTAARFVEGTRIVRPLCVLDVQLAAGRKSLAGPSIARRQNAVEHVDTSRHRFHQVLRGAHTHQVPWGIFWQPRRDVANHFEHHRLLFADAQATDRIAIKTDVYGLFEAITP